MILSNVELELWCLVGGGKTRVTLKAPNCKLRNCGGWELTC